MQGELGGRLVGNVDTVTCGGLLSPAFHHSVQLSNHHLVEMTIRISATRARLEVEGEQSFDERRSTRDVKEVKITQARRCARVVCNIRECLIWLIMYTTFILYHPIPSCGERNPPEGTEWLSANLRHFFNLLSAAKVLRFTLLSGNAMGQGRKFPYWLPPG